MTSEPQDEEYSRSLAQAFQRSGLSVARLWLLQLAVGGDSSQVETEAYVSGLLHADAQQFNCLATALNEHFLQTGDDHRVGLRG